MDVTDKFLSILPYTMMKIQIVSAHGEATKMLGTTAQTGANVHYRETRFEIRRNRTDVDGSVRTMIPAALFYYALRTSNTPMTMFQVLVTMSTAQAVLKYPFEEHPGVDIIQYSIGYELDQLQRSNECEDHPAMGIITFSDRVWIML